MRFSSSSACALILATSPSLAIVLRHAPNSGCFVSRKFLQGRSMSASYTPTVNASGTLEDTPVLATLSHLASCIHQLAEFQVAIDTGSSDLVIVTAADFKFES
ncbi:hypothetical protein C8R43DRAFT_1164099 [Mycena crocata]|nr:hypothetical protein C8R43DRAFT_1164099 [Mycena crocata]